MVGRTRLGYAVLGVTLLSGCSPSDDLVFSPITRPLGDRAAGGMAAVSSGGTGGAISPASHLKYFGYFSVDVEHDDPNDAEVKSNFTDEVGSFSNIAHMAAYQATQDLRSQIDTMNSYCMKPFVSPQEVLYRQVDTLAPSGHHYQLLADYQANWATFKAINGASFTPAKVAAFYLMDQPIWNGVSFDALNVVSQMIKADYPDIPVLLIESFAELTLLQVPPSVDWVGFNRSAVFDPLPSKNASFLANIETLKSKLSNPAQKIFLTIDDRWEPLYATLGIATPEQMLPVIQDYYDLAVSDPAVVGLVGFLWAAGTGPPGELGVRDMPKSIIDLNKQIGAKIKANGPGCAN